MFILGAPLPSHTHCSRSHRSCKFPRTSLLSNHLQSAWEKPSKEHNLFLPTSEPWGQPYALLGVCPVTA